MQAGHYLYILKQLGAKEVIDKLSRAEKERVYLTKELEL